jgi:hypothetical protein
MPWLNEVGLESKGECSDDDACSREGPQELLRHLERLAACERLSVSEKNVRLLQDAIGRQTQTNAPHDQEILERLIRNRFRPDPSDPDVVEMLREDRNR